MISTGSSDAGNSHTNLIHNKSRATEFSPGRFNFQTLFLQYYRHPRNRSSLILIWKKIYDKSKEENIVFHIMSIKRECLDRHLIMSDNNSNDCHSAPLLALPWLTIRPLTDCQTVYIRYTHICLLSYKLKQPAS